MAFNPDFFKVGVSINNSNPDLYKGWRILGQKFSNPNGFNQVGCSTSRWDESTAGVPTNIKGRAEDTALNNNEGYIISRAGGLSTTAGSQLTPTFWKLSNLYDDPTVISEILQLPYFTTMGNTPVSLSDRDDLVLQIYNAGFYIWMNYLRPPLNESLVLNYEFNDSDCWPSTTSNTINNLEPVSTSGTIFGTNPGWNNVNTKVTPAATAYDGYFPTNNSAFIEIAPSYTIGSGVTFEFITGLGLGNNINPYNVFDTPTGNLIRYTGGGNVTSGGGMEWGGLTYNGFNRQDNVRHYSFTGNDLLNTSQLHVNGNQVATGTCSIAMTSWGVNSRLFSQLNGQEKMPVGGGCYSFRIWNANISQTQSEILYLHSRGKIYFDQEV